MKRKKNNSPHPLFNADRCFVRSLHPRAFLFCQKTCRKTRNKNWFTKEKFNTFVKKMNEGGSFE